ncbi:MAG: hypothetical protein L3J20_00855 [Flavobacteriaceae bacterium]|nr:hypothetical protein [Flavobacteriaceae bacterium]
MIKKFIGLLIIFISIQGFSQRNNISPYSFFGIGEESAQKTVEEISMGQIGVAFSSTYKLTFSNPASLASLRFTTYALAVENKALTINDGTNSQSASAASISYMAMGIPIGTKVGLLFGLQPNTTVGYSLLEEFKEGDDVTALNLFTGEGGTNRVFLGFGYKLNKKLNIGLEAAYVFGNIENNLLNRRDDVQLATMHKTDSELSGITAKAGVLYDTKINDKLNLKLGGVINFNNKLSNKGKEYLFSLVNTGTGVISPRDTIVNKPFESTIKNPLRTILSAGLGQENKWYAGVEYSFQNAIEFTDGILTQNTRTTYGKSNRVSFGGFYTPKFNSISSYWQRMTYRAGLNLKQTGLVVNNTSVNDFGISFGVGLPIGQQLSNVNLGFELGRRGEINNELIKENYINFRLSLTLNDRWFKKRKLD